MSASESRRCSAPGIPEEAGNEESAAYQCDRKGRRCNGKRRKKRSCRRTAGKDDEIPILVLAVFDRAVGQDLNSPTHLAREGLTGHD